MFKQLYKAIYVDPSAEFTSRHKLEESIERLAEQVSPSHCLFAECAAGVVSKNSVKIAHFKPLLFRNQNSVTFIGHLESHNGVTVLTGKFAGAFYHKIMSTANGAYLRKILL